MSSYVSCHILNYSMQCQHMCHATSSTMPCHAITTLVFHWVCHAIISTGYSFVILEHLWHQWQLYTQIYQQYPPLALMETSKNSPPLTTMTKENLLWQCCTYLDIGFYVSLLFYNSSYHHISPFNWTWLFNQCDIIYLNISCSWMIA